MAFHENSDVLKTGSHVFSVNKEKRICQADVNRNCTKTVFYVKINK